MAELYQMRNGYTRNVWENADSSFLKNASNPKWVKNAFGDGVSFVFGGESSTGEVPQSRFNSLKEITPHMFRMEQSPDGMYCIRNVPLFKTHGDTRKMGHASDRPFLDRMIKNFYLTQKATHELFGDDSFAWKPKFHFGHTPNNPDLPERECAGFIDNPYRVQDFLFGDLIGLEKNTVDKFLSGRYPDRSAEVDIKRGRLLSVAALGFRTPHFGLPQMRSSVLRKRYEEMVSKHDLEDTVRHLIITGEELPMAKTRKTAPPKKIKFDHSPEEVAKFLLSIQADEELHAEYQEQLDTAIEKYMGEMGMQSPPTGNPLMGIIQQIISSMMSQKMNTQPNNPMMNAGDVIDFESNTHHAAGEPSDPEDETAVDEPTHGGDAGVKKDGTPSESEEGGDCDDDTVGTSGTVVSKNIAAMEGRMKAILKAVPGGTSKHVVQVVEEVTSTLKAMGSLVEKQHKALDALQKDNHTQRVARRKESYTARLRAMFSGNNPNVRNDAQLKEHLSLAMEMPEDTAGKYLANLEKAPPLSSAPVQKYSRNGVVTSGDTKEDRVKNSFMSSDNAALRRAGVSLDQYRLADAWESLDNAMSGEEEN